MIIYKYEFDSLGTWNGKENCVRVYENDYTFKGHRVWDCPKDMVYDEEIDGKNNTVHWNNGNISSKGYSTELSVEKFMSELEEKLKSNIRQCEGLIAAIHENNFTTELYRYRKIEQANKEFEEM